MTDSFDGLEDAIRDNLPRYLPDGARLTSVRLREQELQVEARKAFFSITLTAAVTRSPDRVRLHSFMILGAMGLGGTAMREAIARIDESWPPFRARGEDGGASLVITRREAGDGSLPAS